MGGEALPGDDANGPGVWVLLSYRMPREPSTPRIAVWRRLKRLGVVQISDGLVGLPADARTREALDWIAEEVSDAGGSVTMWLARPTTMTQERELARAMAADRAAEYAKVARAAADSAFSDEPGRLQVARRLRAELRRIERRDYFPGSEQARARAAVEALATPTVMEAQRS